MEEKLNTTLLEFDKSTFIIDLMKNKNGLLYISLQQIIHSEETISTPRKININPSVIDDLVKALNVYSAIIGKTKSSNKTYFGKERKQEIERRYLKGVNSKDLAVQFDCSETIINQILTNRGIELVSNHIPKIKEWWRRKSKKP